MAGSKLGITSEDVRGLMREAREQGLSEFSWNGLSFKLGPIASEIEPVADNPAQREKDLRLLVSQLKESEIEEMRLTNPEEYEDLMNKMAQQRSLELSAEATQ